MSVSLGFAVRELAWLCLRLGLTAFGGPAVHLAMLEAEVVDRRSWLTRQAFLDLLGVTNLIPGPNSTEMVLHVGYLRAGWLGLIVAGVCFIGPAFLIVWGCAWFYVTYGDLPPVQGVLVALKPVMLALLVQITWRLGQRALRDRGLLLIGLLAAAAVWSGLGELLVLLLCALAGWLRVGRVPPSAAALLLPVDPITPPLVSAGLGKLFLAFLKVGSVLYGSGYVLLSFLRSDLVQELAWLTEAQLLDAIAIGQITPGPVFTTATFIGYVLAGSSGAVVATIGIFLPAFVFVAITAPWVERLRDHATARAVLDGVNVGAFVLLAAVTVQLAPTAVLDPLTGVLAVAAALLLFTTRISSMWLVSVAAVVGLLFR